MRWSDIDWETEIILFDEAIVSIKGGSSVKGPKTRASVRPLAVDAGTLDQLRRLRAEREELAADSETVLGAQAFVFSVVRTVPSGPATSSPPSWTR